MKNKKNVCFPTTYLNYNIGPLRVRDAAVPLKCVFLPSGIHFIDVQEKSSISYQLSF